MDNLIKGSILKIKNNRDEVEATPVSQFSFYVITAQ